MDESMIDNCFRRRPLPGFAQPGVLSLTFNRQSEKERFVSLARRKRDLSIRDIGIMEGENNRIFVNESLTFAKRQILKQAKIFKRTHNYKFVWVRNGRVMMKKDENSNPLEIKKIEDLNKLIPKNGLPSASGP
uniref:FP protein C-terminal domain-containing protein n=1 Tax=Lygus hesperus TaxID=30085 RepID=A0A146MBL4_LYGHE